MVQTILGTLGEIIANNIAHSLCSTNISINILSVLTYYLLILFTLLLYGVLIQPPLSFIRPVS